MRSRRLNIPNHAGEPLAATLDLPDDAPPAAFALYAHCFTCGRKLKSAVHIARALTARGLAVLRFDFTGVGESAGDFARTTLATNRDDLLAAAAWLAERHRAPRLLIGHSLGGAAALLAAPALPSVAAVAVLATPSEPSHLGGLLADKRAEALATGEAELNLAGRPYRLRPAFFADLEATRLGDAVRALGRPLLILHAPGDPIVEVRHAAALFRAARHPKSFVALAGADHLLLDERDARHAGEIIAAWADRWVRP